MEHLITAPVCVVTYPVTGPAVGQVFAVWCAKKQMTGFSPCIHTPRELTIYGHPLQCLSSLEWMHIEEKTTIDSHIHTRSCI